MHVVYLVNFGRACSRGCCGWGWLCKSCWWAGSSISCWWYPSWSTTCMLRYWSIFLSPTKLSTKKLHAKCSPWIWSLMLMANLPLNFGECSQSRGLQRDCTDFWFQHWWLVLDHNLVFIRGLGQQDMRNKLLTDSGYTLPKSLPSYHYLWIFLFYYCTAEGILVLKKSMVAVVGFSLTTHDSAT